MQRCYNSKMKDKGLIKILGMIVAFMCAVIGFSIYGFITFLREILLWAVM